MKLEGKVAIVTGASRGIGRAIAEVFAREGAALVLADIDEAAVREAAASIESASGRPALALRADVSERADNEAMFAQALDRFGHVDVLVCNAGVVHKGRPLEDIEPEHWQRVVGVNLMGAVWATRLFAPHAKARGSGRIIYMASVAGEVGGVSADVPYSITKAALICLAKAMARQLGSHGITVNAIAPGAIETAMTDVLEYAPSLKESIPLQRYGESADVAAAALYLASEDAGYVTGTTLDVNGGMFMR